MPSPEVLLFLSKGATLITQTPPGMTVNLQAVAGEEDQSSFAAVEALLKSVGYYFIAAWPGRTSMRDRAYRTCERLFDILLDATAPTIDVRVERHRVQTNGEEVKLYALLLVTKFTIVRLSGILISNGLEGTNVETFSSALRSQSSISSCFFFMEMPGTYAYKSPLRKVTSESIYSDAQYCGSFSFNHDRTFAVLKFMLIFDFVLRKVVQLRKRGIVCTKDRENPQPIGDIRICRCKKNYYLDSKLPLASSHFDSRSWSYSCSLEVTERVIRVRVRVIFPYHQSLQEGETFSEGENCHDLDSSEFPVSISRTL